MKTIAALALCTALAAGLAAAQSDTPIDLPKVRAQAERGNADVQTGLGVALLFGRRGLAKDEAEGVKWLRRAAEQRQSMAELFLGHAYFEGLGVAQDAAQGLQWTRRSAEQGNVTAQATLAGLYMKGEKVPKDDVEGLKWARLAAEKGDVTGQMIVGTATLAGRGTPQDTKEGKRWLQKAADQGSQEAKGMLALAELAIAIDDLEKKKASADADPLAKLRQDAEGGDARSQTRLGYLYAKGQDVERSAETAVSWYRKAAAQGEPTAQFNLGLAYYDGRGVEKDYKQAFKLWQQAAAQGQKQAKGRLGLMYYHGYGTSKDQVEAFKWILLGEKAGDEAAAKYRTGIQGTISAGNIAEARKRADQWEPAKR